MIRLLVETNKIDIFTLKNKHISHTIIFSKLLRIYKVRSYFRHFMLYTDYTNGLYRKQKMISKIYDMIPIKNIQIKII